jgi:hypothetical protein
MTRRTHPAATVMFVGAVLVPSLVGGRPADATPTYAAASCPSPNAPDTLEVTAGTPQTARLGAAFQTNLAVQLVASNGCPLTGDVAGVSVTFTAPASGPGGTFSATGTSSATVGTNVSGSALAPMLTANDTAGSYTVVATSVYGTVTFSLTNAAGAAKAIVAGVGAFQSAKVGTAYLVPFAATVTDADHNPVPGALVTFQAPTTGPSGTFSGQGTTASVVADSAGVAIAPVFTANASPGGYVVTASVSGVGQPASFALVNQRNAPVPPVLSAPVVAMAPTPDGQGYWLVGADGEVYAFGDARSFGSAGGVRLAQPIVGMAATPDGQGYWLVAADGGVFTFGHARYLGSTGAVRLVRPIVGMAATPDGQGYWLVAADGGVFTFGDAPYLGSTGGVRLAQPIVGMAATPDGQGYWLVAADGGVFTFGDARFLGSSAAGALIDSRAVAVARTVDGAGYWVVAGAGQVVAAGDAASVTP